MSREEVEKKARERAKEIYDRWKLKAKVPVIETDRWVDIYWRDFIPDDFDPPGYGG